MVGQSQDNKLIAKTIADLRGEPASDHDAKLIEDNWEKLRGRLGSSF